MDGVNPALPNPAQAASAVAADLRKTARLLVLGPEAKAVPRVRPRSEFRENTQEVANTPRQRTEDAQDERDDVQEKTRREEKPARSAAASDSDAHDKALMVRIAAGDERALGELIEKHQGAVYGTIAKMLGDPIEAQDLAQQVFLRVYRAAGSYRATAQFKTWIFTIVRNLVFNEHRRRSRATLISLSPVDNDQSHSGHSGGLDLPDSNRTPGEDLLQAEMLKKIDEAILALPEQQRLAIVLRRYDEFSYEEIAEILKTSVPATKSLLFRARETLRLALKEYMERDA